MASEAAQLILQSQALTWSSKAKEVKIADQPTYDAATEMHKGVIGLLKEIDTKLDPDIARWHAGHKAAIALKKQVQGELPAAEEILRRTILNWEWDQEQKRLEDQRKAEAAARRAEEEARLALAVQAEQAGATAETIEEIIETPIPMVAPVIAPSFQRAACYSKPVERYHAECFDIKLLCRAVADGKASTEYVQPNLVALNSLARAQKQTFSLPGCKAVLEAGMAVRR